MKKTKLTGERLVDLFLFALSAFYLAYTLANYKIGSPRAPKEGFMPLIVGVGATLVSAFLTIRAFLANPEGQNVDFRISWARFGLLIAASFCYALTLGYIGYAIGTFLFLAAVLFIAKAGGWKTVLLISLVSSAAFYLLFKTALGVMLPVGFLGV